MLLQPLILGEFRSVAPLYFSEYLTWTEVGMSVYIALHIELNIYI
jgi:hypothetical protein